MQKAVADGEFIESTSFSGNIYGTSKKAVREVQDKGRICILDVEIEGVKSLKKTDLNPRFVFVKPPNLPALEERLRCRGTESSAALSERLTRAGEELAFGDVPGNFDLVIVNDDVDQAYASLRNFVLRVGLPVRSSHAFLTLLLQDVEDLKKSRGM